MTQRRAERFGRRVAANLPLLRRRTAR